MYAVAVQNTENLELSLIGPYESQGQACAARDAFAFEMDARYGLLDVYSVWVVALRTLNTEINMFRSLQDLWYRGERENRTLDNLAQLDVM